jgi:hypothetical protein
MGSHVRMSRAVAGLIHELGGQAEVLMLGEGMGTGLRENTHIGVPEAALISTGLPLPLSFL